VPVKVSLVLAGVLMAAPPATAAAPASPPSPSVDQYIESVPTSEGPKRPDAPSTRPSSNSTPGSGAAPPPLPAAAERKLAREGGAATPALRAITSDPGRGAPTATGSEPPPRAASHTAGSAPGALSAAVHAAGSGQGVQLPLLLLGLLAISGAAAVLAIRRRAAGN
jgi:hypothetical protein